jgi:predicted TIM-barrel fold metal-dependent hydrolase
MILPQKMIDFHTHLWGGPDGLTPQADGGDQLIAMADRYHLEALVVMPLFGGHNPSKEEVAAGNRAARDLGRIDGRMKPFVTVFPRHGQAAVDEMVRGIEEYGFFGLKIWVSPANEPCVYPLIEKMIDYGKPTLIHAMHKSVGQLSLESDPLDIAALGRRYPEAKIVMAHIGGNFIYSCGAIRDVSNVMTDPSGSYCERGMVERAVHELGAGRILFGSDAPGAEFLNNVAKVMAADIGEEDKQAIMYHNARRLLA